jgi:DNA-binding transcriptional ArsR family regulator
MTVARDPDLAVAQTAAAIGDPGRARILYCLMDGRARTATELSLVADVSPSTTSAHLKRLSTEGLVRVVVQGKHRYFSLESSHVADVLESLSVLVGRTRSEFVPSTPDHLRAARTCYDHLAGAIGVALHDRLVALRWIRSDRANGDDAYSLTADGTKGLSSVGVDVDGTHRLRRRFAFGCLDWSERRSHLGGALGAALLAVALKRRWVTRDRDGRALHVTALGQRDAMTHFGLRL